MVGAVVTSRARDSHAKYTPIEMPDWRWLALAAIVGLLVAAGFAFTLVGLVAEGVAILAVLALVVKGLLAFAHRTSARRPA
jgi:hypothetical protein